MSGRNFWRESRSFFKNKTQSRYSLKQQFKALSNIPPFLKLVWKTHPGYAGLNIFFRIVKSFLPVLQLYVGKLIIDEIVFITQNDTSNYDNIILYVVLELIFSVASEILSRVVSLYNSLLADLFANKSSEQLIKHAGNLDLEQFEDAEFYDKLERARRQTTSRTALLNQILGQLQNIITIASLSVGLILFSPWLVIILVIAIIPSFLNENYYNEKSYSLSFRWTPQRRELDYIRYIGASDETAKEVKIFGLSDFLTNRFKGLAEKFYDENKKLIIKKAWWGSVFAFIGTLGYYSAFGYIIYKTITGTISIGDLTFLAGSFSRLRSLFESLLSQFSSIVESSLYLKDFFDYFKIKPKIRVPDSPRPLPEKILHGFEFQNVSFKYQNTTKFALKDVSFTLSPSEKIALVGENGAGKTTLVKLLSRLYDPTEGRILLDGYDLREYHLGALRKAVGVVFQDFVKYQLKALENIAVGQIDQLEDFEKIKQASVSSLADQVIEALPDKYEQMIGRRFSNGIDLSGGQWQKMALGRAYMRDARLLILDEPTAALDARAEFRVFERFVNLIEGKMAVLISHRFSTVRMADRIIVLGDGKVKEIGSHNELIDLKGKYYELFSMQARGYQ